MVESVGEHLSILPEKEPVISVDAVQNEEQKTSLPQPPLPVATIAPNQST